MMAGRKQSEKEALAQQIRIPNFTERFFWFTELDFRVMGPSVCRCPSCQHRARRLTVCTFEVLVFRSRLSLPPPLLVLLRRQCLPHQHGSRNGNGTVRRLDHYLVAHTMGVPWKEVDMRALLYGKMHKVTCFSSKDSQVFSVLAWTRNLDCFVIRLWLLMGTIWLNDEAIAIWVFFIWIY